MAYSTNHFRGDTLESRWEKEVFLGFGFLFIFISFCYCLKEKEKEEKKRKEKIEGKRKKEGRYLFRFYCLLRFCWKLKKTKEKSKKKERKRKRKYQIVTSRKLEGLTWKIQVPSTRMLEAKDCFQKEDERAEAREDGTRSSSFSLGKHRCDSLIPDFEFMFLSNCMQLTRQKSKNPK